MHRVVKTSNNAVDSREQEVIIFGPSQTKTKKFRTGGIRQGIADEYFFCLNIQRRKLIMRDF